jgi:hypothetical protein
MERMRSTSAWGARLCDLQHARLHQRTGRGRGISASHHRRGRRRRHRAGRGHLPAHPRPVVRFPDPLLDPDDHHQCGGRAIVPRARHPTGGAGPRELAGGYCANPAGAGHGRHPASSRGSRPRGALRRLLRPVPHQRSTRGTLGQPRRMRSRLLHLGRPAANLQTWRRVDSPAGAVLRCRRLPRAQLQPSDVLPRPAPAGRLLAQYRQSAQRRLFSPARQTGTGHRLLRFEHRPAGGPVAGGAAHVVRDHHPPAHAHVSHGALRFLRLPDDRSRLPGLRSAVRPSRPPSPRPGRRPPAGES